ncbi:MAG: adhesin [Cytophagaceae bacterium]
MPIQNRSTLKGFFRKGQMPSEGHFNDLIDSMINKVDDGMSKNIDDGLMLSPIGASKKLMSFYKSIEEKNPAWSIEINNSDATLNINNQVGDPIISLKPEGKVGINKNNPQQALDVNGVVAMKGRQGTLHSGKIPADGKWHTVLKELNGCHAFEVIAGVGKKKTGKYALLHAFAMSTYGKSRSKIDTRQAMYGARSNQIQLRWVGTTYNFGLEMRTKANYDGDFVIRYNISELWFDHFMDESLDLKE